VQACLNQPAAPVIVSFVQALRDIAYWDTVPSRASGDYLEHMQSRKRLRQAGEYRCVGASLTHLDLLPVGEHSVGGREFDIAKDVGVPAYKLVRDLVDHVLDRELAGLASELRVHDYLQQDISKLAHKRLPIGRVEGVDRLVRLFEKIMSN
jgi:hypothetical protein